MRISVYPRGANPLVDRHIQRKSLQYATEQVELYGAADWVDANDHSKGIICRDHLFFGVKLTAPSARQLEQLGSWSELGPPAEAGLKFIPPKNFEKNPTLPRISVENVVIASHGWDWTMEPATA